MLLPLGIAIIRQEQFLAVLASASFSSRHWPPPPGPMYIERKRIGRKREEDEEKSLKIISWKKKQGLDATFSNRQVYDSFILALAPGADH